jgi:excisionase family DNA binding protein
MSVMRKNKALKPREVGLLLDVNPRTVVRWIHNGDLTAFKAGKVWRIWESDLDRFVKNGRRRGVESK